jgi:hypothetical protein
MNLNTIADPISRLLEQKGGVMRKIAILIALGSCVVFADPPMFQDFVYIEANNIPITVSGGHADPCVIDWDGDGSKDLLLGEFTLGRIRFYANDGNNSAPHFTTFTYLQADGATIQLPYG